MARFHVDEGGLPPERVAYRWRSTAGAEAEEVVDRPVFEVAMPVPRAPVTVTVEVEGPSGPVAFGSRTVLPLSRRQHGAIELLGSLRDLIMASPIEAAWDPLVDRRLVLSPHVVEQMRGDAARLVEAAERLAELEREP